MMKGKLKQLISILLISVLVLSMAAPGFAATATHTLTINSQTAGHTFEIYQIFSGDVDLNDNKEMVLTDIVWGGGVNATELVKELGEALEDPDSALQTAFGNVDLSGNADDLAAVVAKALSEVATKSDAAYAFADVVGKSLEAVYATSTEHAYDKDTDWDTNEYFYYYEINGLKDGYYFLKDQDNSLDLNGDKNLDTSSYTRYIIGIIGEDQTINAKADKPNIDKHIGEIEKTEEYDIGEDIPYQLTSKVPDMEGYTTYWYMAHDTLSKGIDFIQIDKITVGGQELKKARQVDSVYDSDGAETSSKETGSENDEAEYTYTVYNYEYNDASNVKNSTELYIVLNKFCESYKGNSWVGQPIVIDYTVRFNKNAVIGTTGNDNVVDLIYSNNPNYAYDGEPTTTTDENVGRTTKKTTVTFTAGIQIIKYDEEADKNLAGASFKLTGYGDVEVPYYTWEATAEYSYFVDSSGLYVNKNEDVEGAKAEFVEYDDSYSGYTRYSRTTTSENSTYTATTRSLDGVEELIGTTGNDGYVTFKGIGAGIYKLEEVSAPSGYNKLTSPIYIKIKYTDPKGYEDADVLTLFDQPDVDTDTAVWEFYSSDDPDAVDDDWTPLTSDEGIAILSVANSAGSLMPATGGVGTTVFTIVGICAMAGAVIFLYTKKRREDL